jgi:hypothetical protein
MRRIPFALFLVLLTACWGDEGSSPPPAPEASVPANLSDLPPDLEEDVEAANVAAAALIPLTAIATGSWSTVTDQGEAIVVAWQESEGDPLRADRGVALWRRFDDGGAPWRPVWAETFPGKPEPVLGIDVRFGDATGDGSDDAVIVAASGGSGACDRTLVLDIAAQDEAYDESGCDRVVDVSVAPPGLVVTEAVFRPGDAHCCPSAMRTTVSTYDGDRWQVVSRTTEP